MRHNREISRFEEGPILPSLQEPIVGNADFGVLLGLGITNARFRGGGSPEGEHDASDRRLDIAPHSLLYA